jgi:hypothetical protein
MVCKFPTNNRNSSGMVITIRKQLPGSLAFSVKVIFPFSPSPFSRRKGKEMD